MRLSIDKDWLTQMADAEDSVGGIFAAGFLVRKDSSWLWRVDWCKRHELPSAESWAWDLAGEAFGIHQACIDRTIYDAESKQYGAVFKTRVIPRGTKLAKIKLAIDWDDGRSTRGLDLRALHCWDSGYSFV